MRSLLFIIAIVLVAGWALGALVYDAGALIHILLGMAVISVVLGFTRKESWDY